MRVIIINGPNLNLLGQREPSVYGADSFEAYFATLQRAYPQLELSYFQSNHEGALLDKLHEVGFSYDGIILNVAVFADFYRRYIRPNGCRKPHRRMFGQFGITGYMGVPRYKRRFCNRRHMLLVRIFHKNSLV